MTGWLYQMTADKRTADNWQHGQYEATVCEGRDTTYDVRKLRSKGGQIQPGDIIVLFYTPTHDPNGGICGWGIISGYDENARTIDFRPMQPSDYLKTKPIWDNTVKNIIKEIRGYPRGNMWEIKTDLLTRLRQMIEQVQPL